MQILQEIPPVDPIRWVPSRKAQVAYAIRKGLLTRQEAIQRYSLSEEEVNSWLSLLDTHGLKGLRATRMKEYKRNSESCRVIGQVKKGKIITPEKLHRMLKEYLDIDALVRPVRIVPVKKKRRVKP